MARKPAQPMPAPAAEPQNTQGAEDRLKGAQAPDQAEAPQQPSNTKQDGTAGGTEPPADNPPPADQAPAAEAGLSAVMSAILPGAPLAEVPTTVTASGDATTEPQGVLVVTGPKRGRWRAGWHFGGEPRRIPLAGLSVDEATAIRADPCLTVTVELAPPLG